MTPSQLAMQIIASAGEAKSFAFQAVKAARDGNFQLATELMEKSSGSGQDALRAQKELLEKYINSESNEANMLLVHAQDHLMTSQLAQDLIREIIYLYEKSAKLEE